MTDHCRCCGRNPLQVLASVLTMHLLGIHAPKSGFGARITWRAVPKDDRRDLVCWFCAADAARKFGIIL